MNSGPWTKKGAPTTKRPDDMTDEEIGRKLEVGEAPSLRNFSPFLWSEYYRKRGAAARALFAKEGPDALAKELDAAYAGAAGGICLPLALWGEDYKDRSHVKGMRAVADLVRQKVEEATALREILIAAGIVVEDGPNGMTWRKP